MVRYRAIRPRLCALALLAALSLAAACAGDDMSATASEGSTGTTGDATAGSATTAASASATATTTSGSASATATSGTTATSASSDTDTGTTGDDAILEPVGHPRELRGAWVATVFNINFPSAPGLSAAAQEEELLDILDAMADAGLNSVFLQVRPESDALYPSQLEPWSRSLTGTQGEDPGWDPLAVAVAAAHARNLEVHAWLNPYRAAATANAPLAEPHVALAHPEHAHVYGTYLWMDPGAAPVQDHLLAVIDDIISRYDVDGVHFDDYFYPYPTDEDFPDGLTWGAYKDGGGDLSRADWRRHNVDAMVEAVGALVADVRPEVRFGISPFGIYRPGIPAGISGFDQYEGLYADPLKWLDEGWVDYLAPQLYWPTTYPKQAYDVLVAWWASVTTGGRHIFAGNYLSKLGSGAEWSLDEFLLQLDLTRAQADAGARGNIYFSVEPLVDDWQGFAGVLAADYYDEPALTPALASAAGDTVAPPTVDLDGATAWLSHDEADELRAYTVYFRSGDTWLLDQIVPASTEGLALGSGSWAIAAAAKTGVESLGVVVEIP
ncbi:MAG: family 10 glycosylhydrolase [Myxococcales bacterium]|nr:family 10 glycosylhydrolase [Myxococcales bacterium]